MNAAIFFKYIIVAGVLLGTAHGNVHIDHLNNFCSSHITGIQNFHRVNDIWNTTNPCIKLACLKGPDDMPYVNELTEYCPYTSCESDYELIERNDECCARCVKTRCKSVETGNVYTIGDMWQTVDKCNMFVCVMRGNIPTIANYKLSCPKDSENCQHCTSANHMRDYEPTNLKVNYDYMSVEAYRYHPCVRDCRNDAAPMTCHYKFKLEWYHTLSRACYDCPFNRTDCSRPHCIPADGIRRSILVINRMMPGPQIEVCIGDKIIVDVKNELPSEGTTIHWHGIHHRDNPYMDGTPHISQCPISPGTTFRYEFTADLAGTYFWHSHIGMQRGDGVFGALIIKLPQETDQHAKLYDYDLSGQHVLLLQDWTHKPSAALFAQFHSTGNNTPVNILINGKGRYVMSESLKTNTTIVRAEEKPHRNTEQSSRQKRSNSAVPKLIPLHTVNVTQGKRYRFRLINAEFHNCPMVLSIDKHTVTVIASDGYDIEPVEVSSFVSYAGERFDFIINANQAIDNYWIRLKGLLECGPRFSSAFQVAILHYNNAPDSEPLDTPSYGYDRDGLQLNPLNKGPGLNDSIAFTELHSGYVDDLRLLKTEADYKFYIYYDYYMKNNSHFHVPNLYGFNQVDRKHGRTLTPQMNHISMKYPSLPLMPNKDIIDDNAFCNYTTLAAKGVDCRKEFCECSHVLQVSLNSIVELVIIDEGFALESNHPFHMHGNSFRVIGMDYLNHSITVEEVKRLDEEGKLKRNLNGAPIKDTITVPDAGYTIVRFIADNPGYWLFHCHVEFHTEIGMALVFKVGETSDMASAPNNFPTCHDYYPTHR